MARLIRSENKVIAGVAAGVAEHFGWNARTVRLLWSLLAIVTLGSMGLFYLVLWLVTPAADKRRKSYSERMEERLGKSRPNSAGSAKG